MGVMKCRVRQEGRTHNRRLGNIAGQRINAQLFVHYSAAVQADGKCKALVLFTNVCNFIGAVLCY